MRPWSSSGQSEPGSRPVSRESAAFRSWQPLAPRKRGSGRLYSGQAVPGGELRQICLLSSGWPSRVSRFLQYRRRKSAWSRYVPGSTLHSRSARYSLPILRSSSPPLSVIRSSRPPCGVSVMTAVKEYWPSVVDGMAEITTDRTLLNLRGF
jgi:hypothetical protein